MPASAADTATLLRCARSASNPTPSTVGRAGAEFHASKAAISRVRERRRVIGPYLHAERAIHARESGTSPLGLPANRRDDINIPYRISYRYVYVKCLYVV